jgi:hypothetical protein
MPRRPGICTVHEVGCETERAMVAWHGERKIKQGQDMLRSEATRCGLRDSGLWTLDAGLRHGRFLERHSTGRNFPD